MNNSPASDKALAMVCSSDKFDEPPATSPVMSVEEPLDVINQVMTAATTESSPRHGMVLEGQAPSDMSKASQLIITLLVILGNLTQVRWYSPELSYMTPCFD